VRAKYSNNKWYAAKVTQVRSDGRFLVTWADGTPDDRIKKPEQIQRPLGALQGAPAARGERFRTVACVGDSLTEGGYPWHLKELLDKATPTPGMGAVSAASAVRWRVLDCGASGKTASKRNGYSASSQYREALNSGAEVVVVLLGTNDSKWSIWNERNFTAAYTELVLSLVRRRVPGEVALRPPQHLLLVVPPPLLQDGVYDMQQRVINKRLPEIIRQVAENVQAGVVDAFTALGGPMLKAPLGAYEADGCHLTETGDILLATLMKDEVLRVVEGPAPERIPGLRGSEVGQEESDQEGFKTFEVGDRVEIRGLTEAVRLNGERGRIAGFQPETSRWVVQLESQMDSKAIQAINLLPLTCTVRL